MSTYQDPSDLDYLTRELTAFPTFATMAEAPHYTPTLRPDLDWRYSVLADAYDQAQKAAGLDRRAYRGH